MTSPCPSARDAFDVAQVVAGSPPLAPSYEWSLDPGCRPPVSDLLVPGALRPQVAAFLAALMSSVERPDALTGEGAARLVALAAYAPEALDDGLRERFSAAAGYYDVHPSYRFRYAAELLDALTS